MRQPIYNEDEKDLLGYLVKGATSWEAQTVFGYIIARAESEVEAKRILEQQGLDYLKGVWQYYDKDDYDWYPCVIKDAQELTVTVIRTNALGYQEPDIYKQVILKTPDESRLVKSA